MTVALAGEAGIIQHLVLAILTVLALFPLGELSIQIVNALIISFFLQPSFPR